MFNPELMMQLITIRSWHSVVLPRRRGKPLSRPAWCQQLLWYVSSFSTLHLLSCDSWGLGECSTKHTVLSALASLGFPLFNQNICSMLHCWCVLVNNWKICFNISYLNFQNILVASWDEHWLFELLKHRIIYVIEIKVQRADTIKNKEHFGYKGWLDIEGFQWRSCTADYLWARAVATSL